MDMALALLLLAGSPDIDEPTPHPDQWPGLRDSVQRLALDMEILDPREASYIMAKRTDFATDLNLLRRRRVEFEDAPRLVDAGRFPDRKQVNELVLFNRGYRRHLIERHTLELDRADLIIDAIRETDQLYRVWDAVRDARCEFYYVTVRRQALKRLKCLIGEEAFNAAELPPNVPTWRFDER